MSPKSKMTEYSSSKSRWHRGCVFFDETTDVVQGFIIGLAVNFRDGCIRKRGDEFVGCGDGSAHDEERVG